MASTDRGLYLHTHVSSRCEAREKGVMDRWERERERRRGEGAGRDDEGACSLIKPFKLLEGRQKQHLN
jgi:hypothetical protein